LAFEYQGEQHYRFIHHCFSPLETYRNRDEEKRIACTFSDITLIEVPFWWNFQMESLMETIHLKRPDLFPMNCGIPIPNKPPEQKQYKQKRGYSIVKGNNK